MNCLKNFHRQFRLPDSDTTITFVYLPSLRLFVVTDGHCFGQNWIRVSYHLDNYFTDSLSGIDLNNDYPPIARYLAQPVINYLTKSNTVNNDQIIIAEEIFIYFSISLSNKDPKNIRIIRNEFEKYFKQENS